VDIASYVPSAWFASEALHADGHPVTVLVNASEGRDYVHYFVVVPQISF